MRGGRLHGVEPEIVCERVNDFADPDRSELEPKEETDGCTTGVSCCAMLAPGRVLSSGHLSVFSVRVCMAGSLISHDLGAGPPMLRDQSVVTSG